MSDKTQIATEGFSELIAQANDVLTRFRNGPKMTPFHDGVVVVASREIAECVIYQKALQLIEKLLNKTATQDDISSFLLTAELARKGLQYTIETMQAGKEQTPRATSEW